MASVIGPHIEVGSDNVPRIAGTTTKVLEIAPDRIAHHWDADEIQRQYPYLSLAQIYSALAYYHDHQAEIDEAIEQGIATGEQIKKEMGESPLRLKLRNARQP